MRRDRSGALRRPGRRPDRRTAPGPPGPPPGPPGPPKRNTAPPGTGAERAHPAFGAVERLRDARPGVGAERELLDALELVGQREVELEVAGHVLLAHHAAIGAFEARRLQRRDLGVAADRLAHLRQHLQRLRIARRRRGARREPAPPPERTAARPGTRAPGQEPGLERGTEPRSRLRSRGRGRRVCGWGWSAWRSVSGVGRRFDPAPCRLGRLDVAPGSIVVVRRRRMVNGALRLC